MRAVHRSALTSAATILAIAGWTLPAAGAVVTTINVSPGQVPDEQPPRVVQSAPSGFGPSAWQGPALGKSNWHARYLADGDALTALFGAQAATITIADVASISYWTNRPTGTPAGRDWWIQVYTRPDNVNDAASWYGYRLINNYDDHNATNSWVQHSTATGMTFNRNDSLAGPLSSVELNWSQMQSTYGTELVEMISVQTDSAWNGFDGYMDGLVITLTNGDVGRVNFVHAPAVLELAFDKSCYKTGDTVLATISMKNLGAPAVGFQALLDFDTARLDWVSTTYTAAPFGRIILPGTAVGNQIDAASGILQPGQSPTTADALLATIQFTVLGAEECIAEDLIGFRSTLPNTPVTRITDINGVELHLSTIEPGAVDIDNTPPEITSCPGPVTVDCGASTDPPATGTATANDTTCGTVTVTYGDDRSGLAGCNATGTIVRTWTATDCAGLTDTCTQTITVVDTGDPILTACPDDITQNTDPGVCTAVVNYTAPTATDECYTEGFEDPQFQAGAPDIPYGSGLGAPSVNWNSYNSAVVRVPSLTDGIPSSGGSTAHALVDSTVLPAAPNNKTGAFNRLRGYSSVFGDGFRTSVDIYINLADPAVGAKTYGFDISTAVNNQAGSHLRDFIFHAAADDNSNPGAVLIAGSNNSGAAKRNDLETLANHYVITTSGWYTFEWVFRDNGGVLAVDLNLRNAGGTLLFTETRSTPADVIAGIVGGNRYMWFTFLTVDKLPIDNTRLIRNVPVVCDHPSGSVFPKGETTVTCTATDACGNNDSCDFTVTIEDHEDPVIICPLDATIECDESTVPGILYGTTNGGIAIYYNNNGNGETADNQAYFKAQFSKTNTHGAEFTFDNTPLTGNGLLTWAGLYGQGAPTQYGFDFVLQAAASDGSVPTPILNAYDNVDNSLAGRAPVGPVSWAINDYKDSAPNGPANLANDIINSLVRGESPDSPPVDVIFTQMEISQAGPIYTAQVAGKLVSDGIHHWYNPATAHSPLSNFNLNGEFYFSGTLTYDSTGDDGSDLVNFFEGPITIAANSPTTSIGFAKATDNCDLFPVITYTDSPSGTCPTIITRTWKAVDTSGNESTCDQIITVQDTTAPTIDCPDDVVVNADAGLCTATIAPGFPSGVTLDSSDNGFGPPSAGTATWVDLGAPHYSAAQLSSTHFGGAALIYLPSSPVTFGAMTQLSADYNITAGCFGGGTPRFQLLLDMDASGTITPADKNMWIYWGTPPSWNDCPTPGWHNTGNFIGSAAASYDLTQLSGPYGATYATAVGLYGTRTVLRVTVAVDGGWAQGGDIQTVLVDNVQVDGVTLGGDASATDNCDPAPVITFIREDGAPSLTDPFSSSFPGSMGTGVTKITWTAKDACNNSTSCVQTVTVNAVSTMNVTVELLGNVPTVVSAGPFQRCIEFQPFTGPPISTTMTFVNGIATGTIEVPCGHACLTARDPLHTLRSTTTATDTGTVYEASFTGADALRGGNLDGNTYVDILDFGIFVGQNGSSQALDTICGTVGPHADVSGDAAVGTADFTHIQSNFLQLDEAGCVAPFALTKGGANGPVTSISVADLNARGMASLAQADLNRDGKLDQGDLIAWLQGARPGQPLPQPPRRRR